MADPIAPKFELEDSAAPIKRGPGRPKGSTKAAKATVTTSADVKAALASLDMVYELIGTGLLIWGKPASLSVWQSKSATLRESNENALKAAPKLAKFLASAGSTGGAITLLTTHAVAFGALAMTLQIEIAMGREEGEPANDDTAPGVV